MKSVDKYARPKTFITGHNGRIYEQTDDPAKAAKKRWKKRNPEWVRDGKKARHRMLKVKLIAHKGGQCQHCSTVYDGKNAPIFEFHHVDPAGKDFAIGNNILTYSWEKILTEAEKCILLCANCHNRHHGGEW
jgi:hypothetical protein